MSLYVPGKEETDPKKVILSLQQVAAATTTNTASIAAIGSIVESQTVLAGAVPLVSGTAADVTSISLPIGIWAVFGNVIYNPNGATTSSYFSAWTSSVSATQPAFTNSGGVTDMRLNYAAGNSPIISAGFRRYNITTPTTVYLGTFVVFAVSTMSAFGYIGALRVG